MVVNGSMSQLVLDCKYDLTDYDKTGLVIKWYFQRKPYPVYQWIPTNKPQVRTGARKEEGRMEGRKEGRKEEREEGREGMWYVRLRKECVI